jgi:hypothetical protein
VDVPAKRVLRSIHPDRCIVARARKAQSSERIVAQRQATDKLDDDILWCRHLGISIIREADRVLCPSIDAAKRLRRAAARLVAAAKGGAPIIIIEGKSEIGHRFPVQEAAACGRSLAPHGARSRTAI